MLSLNLNIEFGPLTRAMIERIGGRIVSSLDKVTTAWKHLSGAIQNAKNEMAQHAAAVRAAADQDDPDLDAIADQIEATASNLDTNMAAMHAAAGTTPPDTGTGTTGSSGSITPVSST